MFDITPKTELTESQMRRIKMAMRDCNANEHLPIVVTAMEKFLEIYKKHPNHWDTVIKGVKSLNGMPEEEALFMTGYLAKVFIDEYDEKRDMSKIWGC